MLYDFRYYGSMRTDRPEEPLCPLCGDTGWVIEDDKGVGSARRCSCRGDHLQQRLLERASIPKRYKNCRLAKFETTSERDPDLRAQLVRALAISKKYVEDFVEPDGSYRKTGLLFIGPPGRGKTHLAVGVLVELITRYRVNGRFVDITALVPDVKRTFEAGTMTTSQVLDPVVNADVLLLDELGSHVNLTEWIKDFLYWIINIRYAERRPTLFTTNFRLGSPWQRRKIDENLDRGPDVRDPYKDDREGFLEQRLSPILTSRLYEMAMPVELDAVSDYRKQVLSEQARV